MLDREVIKEFLIAEFEDFEPVPKDIDMNILADDFAIYTENDFYEWLKDNFKNYFHQTEFDWNNVKDRLKDRPTKPL